MAELATPSAAAIGTSDTTAAANGASTPPAKSNTTTRPEKPDENLFKEAVEKARKALTDAQQTTVSLSSLTDTQSKTNLRSRKPHKNVSMQAGQVKILQ